MSILRDLFDQFGLAHSSQESPKDRKQLGKEEKPPHYLLCLRMTIKHQIYNMELPPRIRPGANANVKQA
jgi:hypothetical protein